MVNRNAVECAGCNSIFILRISIGYQHTSKFRFACPECRAEIDGELLVDFRNTDGTINSPEQWHHSLRLEGAMVRQLDALSPTDETPWVTIFNDLPIDRASHVERGAELPLRGPTLFCMRMLGDRLREYLGVREMIYSVPESDFKLIRSVYLAYKRRDLDGASRLLDKVSPRLPIELHEIPSICGLLYNTALLPLIGVCPAAERYIGLVKDLTAQRRFAIFELPRVLAPTSLIDRLLDSHVDLMEELFDSRLVLLIGLFLEMVREEDRGKLLITASYQSETLRLYEQLCETSHAFTKIVVAYLNLLKRGTINEFHDPKVKNYLAFFERGRLADTMKMLEEEPAFHSHFSASIDTHVRNAIAHRSIRYSPDGQSLTLEFGGRREEIAHIQFLLTVRKAAQSAMFLFGVLTDPNRVVTDIRSGRLKL